MTRTLPFHRRLHVRIGAVALAIVAAMAAGLLLLGRAQQQRADLEVTQRLNLGLAHYIVEHQPRPLLDHNGAPDRALLMDMAMDVMMTNPAVEVYLLDAGGRIVGHALDGAKVRLQAVDLGPVRALLRDPAGAALPLLGDDPGAPGARNVFSAAAIGTAPGAPQGYLYIVLRGQASQGLVAGSRRDSAWRASAAAVLLASAAAALALLAALLVLTRPLRRLTSQLQAFRGVGEALPPLPRHTDEIGLLDAALQALQARVSQQFEQLERSDRGRRELVAALSHDLRTPLTSIQGYAEHLLLKHENLQPVEREAALRLMLRHCHVLDRRIADLFEMAKLDAGRARPKFEDFCLAELLQDIVDGYQLDARARRVTLTLGEASRSTARVRADMALLERVLQNLIDNALRHTPAGGSVRVELAAGPRELQVSVADTGEGMAQERLAQVFERHQPALAPATPTGHAEPPRGLGLAIARRILQLHGSVIHVHSERGRGTRFDFSLRRV